jgi:hypothetical protein
MTDLAQPLWNPIVAVAIRAVLGGTVIWMARYFYVNPAESFRDPARVLREYPWMPRLIRGMACFCLWGGCFILATAVAVQIFGLHGDLLAVALVTVSAIGAWLLLPKDPDANAED